MHAEHCYPRDKRTKCTCTRYRGPLASCLCTVTGSLSFRGIAHLKRHRTRLLPLLNPLDTGDHSPLSDFRLNLCSVARLPSWGLQACMETGEERDFEFARSIRYPNLLKSQITLFLIIWLARKLGKTVS